MKVSGRRPRLPLDSRGRLSSISLPQATVLHFQVSLGRKEMIGGMGDNC